MSVRKNLIYLYQYIKGMHKYKKRLLNRTLDYKSEQLKQLQVNINIYFFEGKINLNDPFEYFLIVDFKFLIPQSSLYPIETLFSEKN